MTDADLQQAIDKTAALAGASAGEPLRSLYRDHLAALLKVQATRAALVHAPGVRPGAFMEMTQAFCGKCKADRLKEPCKNPSDCGFVGKAL